MTRSIRTTPRGAQDKQLLALTRCELPWTPADYKTRQRKQTSQYRVRSLRRYTDICNKITDNEYNKVQAIIKLIDRRVDLTSPDIISSNREIPLHTGSSDTALPTVL